MAEVNDCAAEHLIEQFAFGTTGQFFQQSSNLLSRVSLKIFLREVRWRRIGNTFDEHDVEFASAGHERFEAAGTEQRFLVVTHALMSSAEPGGHVTQPGDDSAWKHQGLPRDCPVRRALTGRFRSIPQT